MRVHRPLIRAALIAAALMTACGTADNRVDPSDLELRDLLGIAPEVATTWDADQRAAARAVLAARCGGSAAPSEIALATAATVDDRVAQTLADLDRSLDHAGSDALGLARVAITDPMATVAELPASTTRQRLASGAGSGADVQLAADWNDHAWASLATRGTGVLAALIADAGGRIDATIVVPASRLPVMAAYLADRDELLVNPVVLAALEPPAAGSASGGVGGVGGVGAPVIRTVPRLMTTATGTGATHARPAPAASEHPADDPGGNPYSFYGSVGECAAAQRARCEACLPENNCQAITNIGDGNTECELLGSGSGDGYFEICINLALAITSVDNCAASSEPTCTRDPSAADSINTLAANADFLTSPCSDGLDNCLAQIFGAPSQTFPGPGSSTEPSEPPRSTAVSCSNSCSNNANCNFSPSCTGPSGCNGACNACTSNQSSGGTGGGCGGGGGGGGGGCSSGSSNSSGGGCSGNNSSSSGGGCSNGCSNSSSSGCNNGCNNSSGGGCSDGNGCSNSSSGQCNVSGGTQGAAAGVAISVAWALLPLFAAAFARGRKRRRGGDGDADEHSDELTGAHSDAHSDAHTDALTGEVKS